MLRDRGGDQPPLPHVGEGGLITNLSPGEAILFFCKCSKNEGLPYDRGRDIEFGLGGLYNWAGRSLQIDASRKAMQEGHHTILKAVVEKKTKARGPG